MDDIEGKVLQKIDTCVMLEPDLVSTSAVGNVTASSPSTAVANKATTIFYPHNATAASNLYFNLVGTTRKLTKGYVFQLTGLYSLVMFLFYRDLSKRISPFMLILRNDCENDEQKCLVSKIRGTMEFTEVEAKRKGMCKSNNYYLGNVSRCKQLFEELKLMFCFPGISHIWRHEECSYLTILDVYKKICKEICC